MNRQEFLQSCFYPGFWDQILNPSFGFTPILLKLHAGGHLQNWKVE